MCRVIISVFSVFLLVCGTVLAAEAEVGVKLDKSQLGRYGRVEIAVTGIGDFEKPGDTEQVRLDAELVSPSGKKVVVPGFAMRKTKEVEKERWEPVGPWLWRVRYMPDEVGTYEGVVVVTTKDGRRASEKFSFKVTESDSKGIIRVAKNNPWAFEYSDGSPYIAIGHNLGWAGGDKRNRLTQYRKWINNMAANGCNFIRVWFGSTWCFGIQGKEAYVYDEDAAELLERVMKLCEDRGIAVKLCFGDNIPSYLAGRDGPYKQCETKLDFLTKESAKTQWKAMQRYIVARYGASTSIFAWEMWNEMVSNFGHRDEVAAWTEEMCQHVKAVDPHGHLAGNSTGMLGLGVYRQPSVEFTQYHRYGGANHECYETPQSDDQALFEVYAGRLAALRDLGKPVLLAESGLTRTGWGPHPAILTHKELEHPKDKKGYAFHESLWMGFIDGGAGTGHTWWWDGMVDQWDYYPQYKPFVNFVRGVPLNEAPMPPADGAVEPANLRCFVRQNDWGALVWVVNANNGWHELVMEGKEVETVSGGKLTVSGLKDGKYRVEFMDPWKGTTTDGEIETAEGNATVSLPDFEIDVAVKMERVK